MTPQRLAWRGRLARRVLAPLLVVLGCAGLPFLTLLVALKFRQDRVAEARVVVR